MNKKMKAGLEKSSAQLGQRPSATRDHTRTTACELADNRSAAVHQRKLIEGMNDAPLMHAQQQAQMQLDHSPAATLQKQQLESAFGSPVQRVEEEELLQGKAETAQRQGSMEEEELLQGKFDTVQRQDSLEEEELLQGSFETVQKQPVEEAEELLQGKFPEPGSNAKQEEVTQQENRTGMPDPLKAGIEFLAGMDLSDMQVHRNSGKPAQLNALAYAQGNDIHLGPGQEKHLPHEAWHVVQQRQGRVKPTMQMAGTQINDDVGLEKEADAMGEKALQYIES
jgi:hypothetical protein